MSDMREDALQIINESIKAVLPNEAVDRALKNKIFHGEVVVVAIGKAAWNMAEAAKACLGDRIKAGAIVTKYEHSLGPLNGFEIIEAGHPIPDENSIRGAETAIKLVTELNREDHVILLLSGGGSALFEKPMEGITLDNIKEMTDQLLGSGADIVEINTLRKRLSAVKGGRFAQKCGEAQLYSIILSDVIGDRLDVIASGPAYPDASTSEQALEIISKYQLQLDEHIREVLKIETPKEIPNCETFITGNVAALCEAAAHSAKQLGYAPIILTTTMDCQAKEAGRMLASLAHEVKNGGKTRYSLQAPCAIIAGGETVVQMIGSGKGGRNQELALSASIGIDGMEDVVIFSVGSDGTDGPTDAAGGIVDGGTVSRMKAAGVLPETHLQLNDSYHALKASDDLIMTGATGTNVNDVSVILCR